MSLPSKQQCFALWDEYDMPQNIREHTKRVARVADAVAAHIKAQGIDVDHELVNRAALLHDIAKIITIKNERPGHHTQIGAAIVREKNMGENLARVVENHGLNTFSFDAPLEDQIVNYADKRVRHDEIVTLKERIDDLAKRYPDAREIIETKRPLFEEFERKYNIDQINDTKNH